MQEAVSELVVESSVPFDPQQEEASTALNSVKYGITVLKYCSSRPPHFIRLYLHESQAFTLQWISREKTYTKSKLSLKDIYKVSLGQQSLKFRTCPKPQWELCSVSLYYQQDTLDLVFTQVSLMHRWISGLILLRKMSTAAVSGSVRQKMSVQNTWAEADRDGNHQLDLEEVKALLVKLNIKAEEKDIRERFRQVDEDGNGVLTLAEFEQLHRLLSDRVELSSLFAQYCVNSAKGKYMTKETFAAFLASEQEEKLPQSQLHSLFQSYSKSPWTQADFSQFLFSHNDNDVFNPAKQQVHQDMSQSLASYFINSSHNTYLTGHQLKSDSSPEMYSKVLLSGCRCVEVDLWDGDDGRPIVTHGHTLCSKIPALAVIRSIKSAAFRLSPYPVIVTLEMHCGFGQQEVLAQQLRSELGDLLYISQDEGPLPPLSGLTRKILLRGKRPPAGETSYVETIATVDKKNAPGKERIRVTCNPALTDLYSLYGTQWKLDQRQPRDTVSLSEGKITQIAASVGLSKLIYHHGFKLTRIYPAGKRMNSSNFDPTPAWACGAQLAALNYQTPDLPMTLNKAMFAYNGGNQCGYVLKPDYMRAGGPEISLESAPVVLELTVTVISARSIPKPAGSSKGEIVDPFVVLQLHGAAQDASEEVKTATVQDNGFNPVWNSQFSFSVHFPEVAFLSFTVNDEDALKTNFIGRSAVPVHCIRQGYRAVALLDYQQLVLENTALLCHFGVRISTG